ncbi:MAG: substrate-binding domain-containing protein, partial [Clostridiaceae bacterium]|nr:substrate-binding domain-containing protein [Clostridiaceae bacterium]
IADELSISKGTVYRAIHNKPDISPETREKVLELIAKYGYKPDRIARTLSLKSKKIRIGVIYQTIPEFFWDNIRSGIKAAESEYTDFGLEVIYKELKKEDRYEDEIICKMNELIDDDVDGIIMVPINSYRIREKIRECKTKNIAVATLNDDITDSERVFYVGPQIRQSGRIAGELIGKFLRGSGRVLTVSLYIESLDYKERLDGFNEILRERYKGINIVANYTMNLDMLGDKGKSTIKNILENTGNIDAIYNIDGGSLYEIGCIVKESDVLKDVVLIGHEISDGVRELLKDGTIYACISQDPFSQGFFSVKFLFEYLNEDIKHHDRMYTRLDIIMRENMKSEGNIINLFYNR